MKYIIMECHTSYAIALDEKGNFFKVANMHYEVGQSVTDIVLMQEPPIEAQPRKKRNHKWIYGLAAMAACLILTVSSTFTMNRMTYASVYMSINPEVRIDVNRRDIVIGLAGMNDDGKLLINNYSYKEKELNFVMDELVDLAIAMGFLSEGGQIVLALDANDSEWITSTGNTLNEHLNEYLVDKVSVTIQIDDSGRITEELTNPIDPTDTSHGDSENSDTSPSVSDNQPTEESPEENDANQPDDIESITDEKPIDDKPSDDMPSDDKPDDNMPNDDRPGDSTSNNQEPTDEHPEDNKPIVNEAFNNEPMQNTNRYKYFFK